MCIRQNFQLKQTELIAQRLSKPSTSQNGDVLKEQSADSIDDPNALQLTTKDDSIISLFRQVTHLSNEDLNEWTSSHHFAKND